MARVCDICKTGHVSGYNLVSSSLGWIEQRLELPPGTSGGTKKEIVDKCEQIRELEVCHSCKKVVDSAINSLIYTIADNTSGKKTYEGGYPVVDGDHVMTPFRFCGLDFKMQVSKSRLVELLVPEVEKK